MRHLTPNWKLPVSESQTDSDFIPHLYEYRFTSKIAKCKCGWGVKAKDPKTAHLAFKDHVYQEHPAPWRGY